MPDRFKPHNYLDTLAARWIDWTDAYLTHQPTTAARSTNFEAILYPGNSVPPADGRSRATEMYKYGLLRNRLTPPIASGWQLLCADEHVHTPLGYLEWLLNQHLPAPSIVGTQAQSALAALLTCQWYVEVSGGPRISYVTVFEWLKQKFPCPIGASGLIWMQTLAAAMFCTTYTIPTSDALLTDLLTNAEAPRLSLVWLDGRNIALTKDNLANNLIGIDDFDELKPARSLNYWIGKAPEPRGNYSLAQRNAAQFITAFASEEIQRLRQNTISTSEPFRSFLYKDPTQQVPDIIGLLPELSKLPALTQPTLHLMKTLREGAIEAVRQLYGEAAVAEIELLGSGLPAPLPADFPRQKILFGPPGTGKSHRIEHEYAAGHRLARTTFHPDTDYAGFVGAYKPVMNAKNEIEYQFRPQVFAQTYWEAWQHPEQVYFLVIEEINRGNCAQIFGDLFQLLDRDAAHYSAYAGRADTDLAQWLSAQLDAADAATPDLRARYVAALHQRHVSLAPAEAGQWLLLPPNLCLYATMNTSDQSLFPMDSAFKRRWEWEYVPIDYADAFEVELDLGPVGRYNWGKFIGAVNKRIYDLLKSEDKQLGNRFVNPVAGPGGRVVTLATFKAKVLFYLWSDVYKMETENPDSIFYYQPAGAADPLPFSYADLFIQEQDAAILPSFLELLAVPVWAEASPVTPVAPATDVPADAADATPA